MKVVLWAIFWGHVGVFTDPVPVFMKQLVEEVDRSSIRYESSTTDEPQGEFQPMARSYLPDQTNIENGVLSISFTFRQDPWTSSTERQWWLVVGVRPQVTGFIAILHGATSTQHIRHTIQPEQVFVRFNLTDISLPGRNGTSLSLLLSAQDGPSGVTVPADRVLVTSGIELGPLLLVLDSNQLAGNSIGSTRRRREKPEEDVVGTPGCRFQRWSVPTEDLGWNWVVYPYQLSLNLCVGSCPVPLIHHSLNPSNHAIARNVFRTIFRRNVTVYHPDVQCVPISFRVTSMLLQTAPGNYTLVTSDDLSASRCGCR